VLTKIRRHQKSDGTWDARGWAPALSQAVAGKALNRAAQAGAAVDETTRARAEEYAGEQFNEATGGFKGEGSAGVGLYGAASSLGTLSDSVNTNDGDERDAEEKLAKTKDQAEKKELQAKLQRYREVKRKKSAASGAVVNRLADPQFRAGFGSNGGEEFLSYMLVSESLVVNGGAEWKKWDAEITANINRVQNADGSWTGHHCITGRTFVTSSALLVLMADRAPVPLAAKIKRG